MYVLVIVDFEIFVLKLSNNVVCKIKKKKADKEEEGRNLSEVVLTFLEMAFLLGFMNACGEIILELKKNYRDHQIQVPYFIKVGSHYTIYQLNQKFKAQCISYEHFCREA